MNKTWGTAAGLMGAAAVAAGAFGAHALKGKVPAERLEVFETAARYHLIHAVVLFGVAMLMGRVATPSRKLEASAWLFLVGMLVFSGTLYVLAKTGIGWLGAVTPVGGAMLILGWVALAWAASEGETEAIPEQQPVAVFEPPNNPFPPQTE